MVREEKYPISMMFPRSNLLSTDWLWYSLAISFDEKRRQNALVGKFIYTILSSKI